MPEVSTHDLYPLLLQSVRYCLGRRTTAVSECAAIVRHYASHLTPGERAVILRDIREHGHSTDRRLNVKLNTSLTYHSEEWGGPNPYGDRCDWLTWRELAGWLAEMDDLGTMEDGGGSRAEASEDRAAGPAEEPSKRKYPWGICPGSNRHEPVSKDGVYCNECNRQFPATQFPGITQEIPNHPQEE